MERDLTEKQVMKIHEIIERHSTDVVDYELATDDINAYLLAVPSEPQASPRCTCGHLVTVHYGPGNPCCACHCEHFVPERDAPEPAKPQASEPQVQVSGPQCVKCGAFTTYARVRDR